MTAYGGVASFMPEPLYPQGVPGTHWIGGWVCLKASLDDVEKILDPTGT
jgi:hypothetical protein